MKTPTYRWQLREVMATRGLFATTDLVPLLAERGIELSTTQVFRLVTGTPERLNLTVLAALCDALDCTPNDLIEPAIVQTPQRKTAAGGDTPVPASAPTRPRRARIVDTPNPGEA